MRVNRPTKVRVTPKGGHKGVRIFEMIPISGKEPVLRELSDHIKAGGTVTLLNVEECQINDCICRLGKLRGSESGKTIVMILDDKVDIELVN